MKQKRTFDPYIELQDELLCQIHHALQGGIILQISNWCMGDFGDRKERTECIASGSKIDNNFMSDVYKLCLDVKKTLDFDEDVEFYLTQNPEANATAYLSMIEGKPHIVNIYSGLFNLMDEDELKDIVGHEIGHLINKDQWVNQIMNFVYPDMDECPLYLKRRYDLYRLIAELSADRCGYLAHRKLEVSISASYKLSTGVNIWKHEVDLPGMLKNNEEQLDKLFQEGTETHSTHPYDPIRIKAIEVFANAKTDEELEKYMDFLIEMLMEAGCSEEDRYMMDFITTAGMMMAVADGEATIAEHNSIIEKLGEITFAPEAYFEKVSSGNIEEIYNKAVNMLCNLNKEEEMIRYLAEISLSDGRLDEPEVAALLDFSKKINCPNEIFAQIVGQVIREQYQPLAINMSKKDMALDELPPATEAEVQEQQVEDTVEEEMAPKFVMEVKDKTTDRSHHLMLCGKVVGVVNSHDKVIITNGTISYEDEVLGIKVRYSVIDSTNGIDPKEEIELCLVNTTLRDISGKITDWRVVSVEPLNIERCQKEEAAQKTKTRGRKSKKEEETPEEIPVIESEPIEIEWEVPDEERKQPNKKNTLYLPIKQNFFDQIIEGKKKVEYRELTVTTYKKYIETDDEEDPILEKDLIHDVDACQNNYIFPWNEGECPFIPKDIQYLDLAVGYNKERDTARVEVVGYSFIPCRNNGTPVRFFLKEESDGRYVPELNPDGDCCKWIIALHLGRILECNRAKK